MKIKVSEQKILRKREESTMLNTCEKLFDSVNDIYAGHKNFKKCSGNHSIEVTELNDGIVFRFKYHDHTIVSFKLDSSVSYTKILKDPETCISDCGYNTISTKRAIGSYIELIHENFPNSLQYFKVDSEYAKRKISEFETL